jgi:starch synthase
MRILLASSELYPFSKTGGLADMVAALGKALARAGHEVRTITPLYAGIHERFGELERSGKSLQLSLGNKLVGAEVWQRKSEPNLDIYFLDEPQFYQRAELYQQDGADYPDNAERFIFFAKAVASLAQRPEWKPQIVHLHDWQSGFAALFLHQGRASHGNGAVPHTCMTVHNLAYQGLFPASQYSLTNLPWDYFTPNGIEFYGQACCLKAGVVYADAVTTVSPRYAHEITTPEFGCGLDGLMRQRQSSLHGILNGVDYDEWNPQSDPYLIHSYSADNLSGKAANKRALQWELGLDQDPGIPLFGNIGRLVEQKGVPILLDALEPLLATNIQFVQLGNGEPAYEKAYQELALRFPSRMAVHIGYDEGLSHRVEAACDFFVMPSRFEPCGLNQMYSLRYGTVPIVRAVGGLDDTVVDIREKAELANGIKFNEYSSQALMQGFRKALALYAEPELFRRFQMNGMKVDFSWDRTADQFLQVYKKILGVSPHEQAERTLQPK